jgi:hypothetical protein
LNFMNDRCGILGEAVSRCLQTGDCWHIYG